MRFTWTRRLRTFIAKRNRRHERGGFVLRLEHLEDRLAPAGTFVWSGLGDGQSWADPRNWVGNTRPTGTGDDLVFPAGPTNKNTVNNLSGGGSFNSITISGDSTLPGYSLRGAVPATTITLGAPGSTGGNIIVNTGAVATAVSFGIKLGGSAGDRQFFTVDVGADLNISGKLQSSSSASELAKTGAGTLILSADNSLFSGPISVAPSGGILNIRHINALGTTTAGTTIGQFGQLQIDNVPNNSALNPLMEPLILNGPGPINNGALLNLQPSAFWGGKIQLDSDASIGGIANTELDITGVISDLGSGHGLTKEGEGRVILTAANTYRGLTTVDLGVLTVRNPLALGPAVGTAPTGVLVNSSSTTGAGTLELDLTGATFFEHLTLNGSGFNGARGSLSNASGFNIWAANVILGSPVPNGVAVSIGVESGSQLTISGVISDPNQPVGLTKFRPGRLIFDNANTYDSFTTVAAGALQIRDSLSLGSTVRGTSVAAGAALELAVEIATPTVPRFDPLGRDRWDDSITGFSGNGPQHGLRIFEHLTITGLGLNAAPAGALHSRSGINQWFGGIDMIGGDAAIGVEPDPNQSNTYLYFTNDYSLTVGDPSLPATSWITGNTGTDFHKTGQGHLILPIDNPYTSETFIEQGWVTVRSDRALGEFIFGGDTIQPRTFVSAGASLHLKSLTPGGRFDLLENLTLDGTGIDHRFSLISDKGALVSLGGNNTLGGPIDLGSRGIRSSDIELAGTTGFGVQLTDPGAGSISELTITASISNATNAVGGITKFGAKRLNLQGDGSYTGPVNIEEGILRAQHDTALGLNSTGTNTGTQTYTNTTTTIGLGNAEIQSITITGTSSTYRLFLNNLPTLPLAFNASAAQVQAALQTVLTTSGIGGTVSVAESGNVRVITFGGSLFGVNMPTLGWDSPAGGGVVVAIQTLLEGDGATLELANSNPLNNGGISAGLNIWNESLILQGVGSLLAAESPLTVLEGDHLWHGPVRLMSSSAVMAKPDARVTFQGPVDDVLNTASPTGSNLIVTGGTGVAEVQEVTVDSPTAGTFRLSFNGETTLPIPVGSDALVVQRELNKLSTIGGPDGIGGYVQVVQAVPGGPYIVTFGGTIRGSNQPAITGGPGTTVTTVTITEGSGGIGGKLALAGAGTFRGTTVAQQGALVLLHSQALGTTGTAEIQSLIIPVGVGIFTLEFRGATTTNLDSASASLAADIAAALNNLPPIQLSGGSVTVTRAGTNYLVTFGGLLLGYNQPMIIASTTAITASKVQDGAGGTMVVDGASLDLQGNLTIAGEPLIVQGQGDAAAVSGAGIAEVQTVTVTGIAGSFTLTFDNQTTGNLPFNVSASAMESALNVLPSIGGVGGQVTVSKAGTIYTVTFLSNLRGSNQPTLLKNQGGGTTVAIDTIRDGGSAPPRWFNTGAAGVNGSTNASLTAGNQAVSGRVTSIVVDPTDEDVIYIATASGGAWKTKDGGHTWVPLFDSSPVQRIYLSNNNSTTTQFTLTFGGYTTNPLNVNTAPGVLAAQIEAELNALPSIGGVHPVAGSVKVLQQKLNNFATNDLIFDVRFGGSLSGITPPLMTATGISNGAIGGAAPHITGVSAAMYVGAIALDPHDPRIVYIGTGEANNSTDSFYGTGVYKSLDSGKTWTLLTTSDGTNPLVGLGITDLVVDPGPRSNGTPTGRIFVSTSNQGVGLAPGGSVLSIGIVEAGRNFSGIPTVTISPPAVGGTQATAVARVDPVSQSVREIVITNPGSGYGPANPAIVTIGGGGGTGASAFAFISGQVGIYRFDEATLAAQTITLPAITVIGTPGAGTFRLTFLGAQTGAIRLDGSNSPNGDLAGKIQSELNLLAPVQANLGFIRVSQSFNNPLLFNVSFLGGLLPRLSPNVLNNPGYNPPTITLMSASGANGAPNPVVTRASTWVNLTVMPTPERVNFVGAGGTGSPDTPGPTDNFTLSFPSVSGSWTDLSLEYFDNQFPTRGDQPPGFNFEVPVLYASLGMGSGNGTGLRNNGGVFGIGNSNAVYRSENPTWSPETAIGTTWYVGDPGVPQNEIQDIVISPFNGVGDNYQLGFRGSFTSLGQLIPVFPVPPASLIQSLLNALPTIGGVGGNVTVTGGVTSASTVTYRVTFGGSLSRTNLPALQFIQSNPPTSPGITINTVQDGSGIDSRQGGFLVPAPAVNGNIKFGSFTTPNPGLSRIYTNVILYAAVTAPPGNQVNGLNQNLGLRWFVQSFDGGKTWTANANAPPNYMAAQGNYDSALYVAPNNNTASRASDRIFVGGHELSNAIHNQLFYFTVDGGATVWTERSFDVGGQGPHTSFHALAANNGSSKIFAGTDGGIWVFDVATQDWTDINGNLAITQFNAIAGHPTNINIAYGGSRLNGTEKFNNDLAWTAVDGQDGGQVIVDPRNPTVLYHVQNTTFLSNSAPVLRRSTDSGANWTTIHNTLASVRYPTVAIDNVNPSRLVVANFNSVQYTLNADTGNPPTWVNLNAPLATVTGIALATYQGPFAPDSVFDLVTDKGPNTYDPDTIYVTNGQQIFVTKNYGVSWSNRTGNLANLPIAAGTLTISDIIVDPGNRDTVYVVRSRFDDNPNDPSGLKIYKTTTAGLDPDGAGPGQAWTEISFDIPDLPIWKVVVDPRNGDVYAGTDRGVYMLPTGSTRWQLFGSGLANVQVKDLELNLTTNMLLAGTYGRSMYQLFLDDMKPNAGALRAISGSSQWTGTVQLLGDLVNNSVTISANGTQAQQNGINTAELNIIGRITDRSPNPGNDPRLIKAGLGDVILSNANLYGGVTEVKEGVLVIRNPKALGQNGVTQNTIVDSGASLHLETDLELEPITLFGPGILPAFNGHNTGALRNVLNNNTYTGPLTLGSDTVIGVDTGTSLTIGSKATLLGTGMISDDSAGNAWQLTKELTGTLILASANDYKGLTLIAQGAVRATDALSLGTSAGGTRVLDGAQLQMASPAAGPTTVIANEMLTLSGTGIAETGALLNTSGSTVWQGPVLLTSDPGFAAATFPAGAVSLGVTNAVDTLTIDGVISEIPLGPPVLISGLSKVGPGTLVLTKANTYGGTTYVHSGIVRIQDGQAFGTANNNEIQRVTVLGPTATGTFTLSFKGQTTNPIAVNAPLVGVGGIQTELAALSTIGAGNVSVTRHVVTSAGPLPVTYWVFTITFQGALAGLDQPLVTALSSGGASTVISPVAEGQTGTLVFANDPNGPGAIEIDGDPLGVGANLIVQAESIGLNGNGIGGTGTLRNLSGDNFWRGPVVMVGDGSVGAKVDTSLTIQGRIQDYLVVTNDPAIAPTPPVPAGSLTKLDEGTVILQKLNAAQPENSYSGQTLVTAGILNIRDLGSLGISGPERQRIDINGPSGTFFLRFNGQTTAAINILSPTLGADIQAQLNQLSTIQGLGAVVVTQDSPPNKIFTITFTGGLAMDNQSPITVVNASPSVTVRMTTIQDGPEGTTVNPGATLQLENIPGPVTTELLTLNGQGVNGAGALENLAGNNTWTRTITLGSDSDIGVTQDFDTLILSGQIVDGTTPVAMAANQFGVTKVGPGTLAYTGTTSNTYDGLTKVDHGTLLLDKDGPAVPFAGDLEVGDTLGAIDSAIVLLGQANEIPDDAQTTIFSDGLLDLNDLPESIDHLIILDGHARTGAGALTVNNELDMQGGDIELFDTGDQLLFGPNATIQATSSATESATIHGIGGTIGLATGTRVFDVADGPQAVDLLIEQNTRFTGSLSDRLVKDGAGVMDVDSDSSATFTGITEARGGILQVDGTLRDINLNGGTLGGVGTVGVVTGNAGPAIGTVAPGDQGTGVLTSGDSLWGQQTNFVVELNNPIPGLGHDQLQVNGTIDLTDSHLTIVPGPDVISGQSFTIIQTNGGGVLGQFAEGTVTFVNGKKHTIDYVDSNADTIIDQVVLNRVKADVNLQLVASTSEPKYGQLVTFTLTVTSESGSAGLNANSQVVFILDGTSYGPFSVGNGIITFDPQTAVGDAMNVGPHTLEAQFLGDDDFNGKTTEIPPPYTVLKADTRITPSHLPTSLVSGQPFTIFAAVTPLLPGGTAPVYRQAAGTLTYSIDGVPGSPIPFTNGNGQLSVPAGLPAGVHRVRITYSGNGDYNNSTTSSNYIINISQAGTTTTVTPVPTMTNRGEAVTFTALVAANSPGSGIPAGQIRFYYDVIDIGHQIDITQTLDTSGQASVTTSMLPAGVHTIFAVYAGNASYITSTGSQSYTVTPGVTQTTLVRDAASPSTSTFGEPITFEATVSSGIPANGIPVGNMVLRVDGAPWRQMPVDALGMARFTVDDVPAGARTFDAVFVDPTVPAANAPFGTSTSAGVPQTIQKADTRLDLVSKTNPSVRNQPVVFEATVVPQAPSTRTPSEGFVTFFVNGIQNGAPVAVTNGVASTSIVFTVGGVFNVTASFSTAPNYNDSTSTTGPTRPPVQQSVVANETVTTLQPTSNPSRFGEQVSFLATVKGGPFNGPYTTSAPGTVTFLVPGMAPMTRALNANGQVVLKLGFGVGTRRVEVRYNGAASFTPSNASVDHETIAADSVTTVTTNKRPAYIGQGAMITATITSRAPGVGIPVGKVRFFVDGVDKGEVNVVQGKANLFVAGLSLGAHTIHTEFTSTNGNHNASSGDLTQFVVNPTRLTAALLSGVSLNNPFAVRVVARGADNSVANGFNGPVSFRVIGAPPGGIITGNRQAMFVNGIADFRALVPNRPGRFILQFFMNGMAVNLTVVVPEPRVS